MEKRFEDFLFKDASSNNNRTKILHFSEYRKGSSEYGQMFQDLMMVLRLKKEENKDDNYIILSRKDIKNIDFDKLLILIKDEKKMRQLGMSFDVEIIKGKYLKFTNLGNKESRPWESKI